MHALRRHQEDAAHAEAALEAAAAPPTPEGVIQAPSVHAPKWVLVTGALVYSVVIWTVLVWVAVSVASWLIG